MSTAAAQRPRVSVEAYLAMEAAASERHILWDGEVFSVEAMAGGTFDHGTVCANIIAALHGALRSSRCRVVTSDVKVWVPRRKGFVYPDATVLCGRAEAFAGTKDVLTNPMLLVEVLSDGTEKFDRGEKFEGYRSIPSLRHYVMVSTQDRLAEHFERVEEGAWLLRAYGPGELVTLKDPDITVSVDELYRMAFEADEG